MNLIVCFTPLQVLIAEKIIESFPNEQFFGCMLYNVRNKKIENYEKRLKNKCKYFFSMNIHTSRFRLLLDILKLKYFFYHKKFNRVFLSNINELSIQFLLSTLKFSQLNTFDDGTANIVKNSFLYVTEPLRYIRKIINFLFGNVYSLKSIKPMINKHYTIYPGFENISLNTVLVNILEGKKVEESIYSEPVNILLGQPLFNNDEENIKLVSKVIEKFNISFYFPHPRETFKLKGVNYIDTELIFEDYASQYFHDRKYRVYTYFSSAALNIANKLDNIEVISLRVDIDNPSYISSYDLFSQFGIKIVKIK